jgi:hypothetical protein
MKALAKESFNTVKLMTVNKIKAFHLAPLQDIIVRVLGIN